MHQIELIEVDGEVFLPLPDDVVRRLEVEVGADLYLCDLGNGQWSLTSNRPDV